MEKFQTDRFSLLNYYLKNRLTNGRRKPFKMLELIKTMFKLFTLYVQ